MIDKNKVQTGDIILYKVTKRSAVLAKLISWFSVILGESGSYHRTYSHVALVENQETMLEMTYPGSKRSYIPYEKDDKDTLELWRVQGAEEVVDISSEEFSEEVKSWFAPNVKVHRYEIAIESGKRALNIPYNIPGLVFRIFGIFIKPFDRGCSQWISKRYKDAGLILSVEGKEDSMESPNEIADSKITRKICG